MSMCVERKATMYRWMREKGGRRGVQGKKRGLKGAGGIAISEQLPCKRTTGRMILRLTHQFLRVYLTSCLRSGSTVSKRWRFRLHERFESLGG